jgi:3-dehydroquinate synthase
MAEPAGLVLAAGGGAVVSPTNREALAAGGVMICLDATPEMILRRIGDDDNRPMLAGSDRLARIRELLAQRAEAYAAIPVHLDTTHLSIAAAAERVLGIAAGLPEGGHRLVVRIGAGGQGSGGAGERGSRGAYDVLVAGGLLAQVGQRLIAAGLRPGRCAVVTNPTVRQHHGATLIAALAEVGFEPMVCEAPDGEAYKTLATVAGLYTQLADARLARNEPVIALGGGVIGDMAGFVAATWLRGVPFVQVPTSLLAMVDASVGGKVAVDLPQGKNLVGAFKQPELVLIDPEALATLPATEFRSGLAEILKAGVIGDAELFERLERGTRWNLRSILSGVRRRPERSTAQSKEPNAVEGSAPMKASWRIPGPHPSTAWREKHRHSAQDASAQDASIENGKPFFDQHMTGVIADAVRVKTRIVERDPFEMADRAWLNLGHTFGHALELLSGYTLRHGEAVGLGMIAAAELSASLGLCAADLPLLIRAAVERLSLPTRYAFDPAAALAAMGTDKKRRGRSLRFVLIREIGKVEVIENVPEPAVMAALERIHGV